MFIFNIVNPCELRKVFKYTLFKKQVAVSFITYLD